MKLNLNSDPDGGFNQDLVASAKAFANERVAPYAAEWEMQRKYPVQVVRAALKEFGGILAPKTLGGRGETVLTMLMVLEELAKVDIGFALAFNVPANVILTVALSGNESLMTRFLPKLITGELIGTFCLTEPTGGSDAANVHTKAVAKGNTFIVNGQKSWVLGSQHADAVLLFARTESDTGGISAFLCETDRNGIERLTPYELLAANCTQCADLVFSDFVVQLDEQLLEAGQGFKLAMRALDIARLGIAAISNGALQSGLECSLNYAAGRELFKSPLLEKQGIQWAFADHVTQLEASRLLTFRAASLFDSNKGNAVISAHAKKFANVAIGQGLTWALRAMGGIGTTTRYPLARQLAASDLLFNTDGPVEIMNTVIGRSLFRSFRPE